MKHISVKDLFENDEQSAEKRRLWFENSPQPTVAAKHPAPWTVNKAVNHLHSYVYRTVYDYVVCDAQGVKVCECDDPFIAEAIVASSATIGEFPKKT